MIVNKSLLATAANHGPTDRQRAPHARDLGLHVAIQAINIEVRPLTQRHCLPSGRRSHISLVTAAGRSGGLVVHDDRYGVAIQAVFERPNQNLIRHGHGKVVIAALRSQPRIAAATIRSNLPHV